MSIRQSSIVVYDKPTNPGDSGFYYFAIPNHMTKTLKIYPTKQDSNGEIEDDGSNNTLSKCWITLSDYGQESGDNQFRLIVFPYNPEHTDNKNISAFFNIQAQMQNKAFSLFSVSWVLGDIFGIRLDSSTGLDALNEYGLIDAIGSVDKSKAKKRYNHYSPGRIDDRILTKIVNLFISLIGMLEYYDQEITEMSLKQIFNCIGDEYNEHGDHLSECATKYCDKQMHYSKDKNPPIITDLIPKLSQEGLPLDGKARELINSFLRMEWSVRTKREKGIWPKPEDWPENEELPRESKFWKEHVQKYNYLGKLFFFPPDSSILHHPIYIKIKRCFGVNDDSDSYSPVELTESSDYLLNKYSDRINHKDNYYWLRLKKEELREIKSEKMFKLLPDGDNIFTNITIGIDYISATLSIHLKQPSEQIPTFTINSEDTEAGGLSIITRSLGNYNFNFRTIFHRHAQQKQGRSSQRIELTADISNSPIKLLNEDLAMPFIRNVLKSNGFDCSVDEFYYDLVNGAQYNKGYFPICSCNKTTQEAMCTEVHNTQCVLIMEEIKKHSSKNVLLTTALSSSNTVAHAICKKNTDHYQLTQSLFQRPLLDENFKENVLKHFLNAGPYASVELGSVSNDVDTTKELFINLLFKHCTKLHEDISSTTDKEILDYLKNSTDNEIAIVNDSEKYQIEHWGDKVLGQGMNGFVVGIKLTEKSYKNLCSQHKYNGDNSFVLKYPKASEGSKNAANDYGKEREKDSDDVSKVLSELDRTIAPWGKILWLPSHRSQGVILERIDGNDLKKYFHVLAGDLKFVDIFKILINLIIILEAWLEKGVMHFDIKPDNIMIIKNSDYEIKMLDLGLVAELNLKKEKKADRNRFMKLNKRPWVFGTMYHVPDEIEKNIPVSEKTMVYQCAAMACALFGDVNYPISVDKFNDTYNNKKGGDAHQAFWEVKNKFKPRPPEYLKHISKSLYQLLENCLKEEAERESRLSTLRKKLNEIRERFIEI